MSFCFRESQKVLLDTLPHDPFSTLFQRADSYLPNPTILLRGNSQIVVSCKNHEEVEGKE